MAEDSTPDLAEDMVWFFIRILFGPWPVMWVAGSIHHDVWAPFPAWSWTQSTTVALGLIVAAWFFRR